MRARVKLEYPWWYGQVTDKKGNWYNVTINCYTRIGASIELKKWIKRYRPKEFEIYILNIKRNTQKF